MFAPTVGMDFDSSQEAYELYNLFAWENGFGIRHGRTRFSTKKRDSDYQLMQEFVCQCQGRCENDNAASCRTECKASLRLLRTTDHGWYVSMFDNTHNHPLLQGREEKRQWNSHSVIDPVLTDFIRSLRENNVSLGKVYNILNATHGENTGVLFRKENLRYLCSRISRESIKEDMDRTMQLLEEMKVADPYLTVKVEHDSEGSVKAILWSSGKNQEDYMYFGDVVTFDTTYRTNLYNMPFGIFVGVNNHFQSIIFGGVLLREETVPEFEWAFKTFVEIMGGKPPATMPDQCRSMETAIKNTLQTTRHRWCKWHILKCAMENLGRIYSKNYDFKKEFHSVINDILCVQEFEEKWDELLERYKLKQNKYLQNLYSNRTKWAKPYFAEIFCAGMTSTQRSESANHLLKQYILRSSTMHLFVKQYNNLLRSRTSDEGKEQHITNMKKRKYNGGFPLEVDAAQIYTNAVYCKFEDELYTSSSLVVTDCISPNEFEVKQAMPEYMVEYHARPFKVTILDDGQLIQCNCGYFEHIGMLCRHAIKIMLRNDILKIPRHNIVKRWTRQAKEGCSGVMTMHTNATQADEIATRQNILYVAALEAVKEVALCNDMMEKALRMFQKIKTEAASRRKNTLHPKPSKPISNNIIPILDATNVPGMKPPKRVKPQGRPATLRIKSPLEYVKMFTQKNKPVTSLYGDENIQPSGTAEPGFPPQANSGKSLFARTILCGRCRKPGHNRSSCKVRGME